MMKKDYLIDAMNNALRNAVEAAADDEIEKMRSEFEQRMKETRTAVVGKILAGVEMVMKYDAPEGRMVVQIIIKN